MQQLSGLDASFLTMETATTYGHVSSLAIFDPNGVDGTVTTLADVRELLEERLHLLPPARRRLVEVPFNLDHPWWIEDPDFDLDFHLREIAIPAPGDKQQLAEQVARIVARPLDRSRPLWEMYFISGLEGGLVAQLTKMHHCAIDGVSGAEVLANLLDLSPEVRKVDPPDPPWTPDPVPTPTEMLGKALGAMARYPYKLFRLQQRTLQQAAKADNPALAYPAAILAPVLANLGALGLPVIDTVLGAPPRSPEGEVLETGVGISAPKTSFNRSISAHRRFAYGSLSLDRVKAIKNAGGATVNDVVLGVCTGALRDWLIRHDELPDDPLVAMVPVSVRTEAQQGALGNQVSAMMCPLPTNIVDPAKRLEAIHDSMAIAKDKHAATPADLLTDFTQFTTPALAARANRLIARTRIVDRINPPINVVISNVPGPPFPLYSAGAKLIAAYPVSAITDSVGLNMTVMSYCGNLDFGLVADRDLVPDLWTLIDGLHEALEELGATFNV